MRAKRATFTFWVDQKWSILGSWWKPKACSQKVLPNRSILNWRQFGWNSNTVQCSKLPDNPKRRIFEFLEMTSSSHLSNASMCDEFIFPPPHSSLRRGRELGEFSALHSTPFSVVGCHHLQQAKHSLRSCQSVQLFLWVWWVDLSRKTNSQTFLSSLFEKNRQNLFLIFHIWKVQLTLICKMKVTLKSVFSWQKSCFLLKTKRIFKKSTFVKDWLWHCTKAPSRRPKSHYFY